MGEKPNGTERTAHTTRCSVAVTKPRPGISLFLCDVTAWPTWAKQGILKASWVKVDAEGIDPYILHGMEGSLRAKAVLGLQFEFSELWELKNRTHTLRHAVDFLDRLGYHTPTTRAALC